MGKVDTEISTRINWNGVAAVVFEGINDDVIDSRNRRYSFGALTTLGFDEITALVAEGVNV